MATQEVLSSIKAGEYNFQPSADDVSNKSLKRVAIIGKLSVLVDLAFGCTDRTYKSWPDWVFVCLSHERTCFKPSTCGNQHLRAS